VKTKILILILLTAFVLGGCSMSNGKGSASPSEMDPKDLPNVPAFQDEFTRDFLQSTEPVREGYYPLEGLTGKFTMDFPEDMYIGDKSYDRGKNNSSERLIISHKDETLDLYTEIRLTYYDFMDSEESIKSGVSSKAGEELEFRPLKSNFDNQSIEVAESKDEIYPGVMAVIWNENRENIQLFSMITCSDNLSEDECSKLVEDEKERVMNIFQSIKLTQSEGE
jgi:hypothetical protein